jgi:hypothetical protein
VWPPPWKRAAVNLAVIEGRLVEAADILAANSLEGYAAEVRLAAAKTLVRQGRHAEAQTQVNQALPFFRSFSATDYIGEAEELLAVSQSETETSAPQSRS